MIAGIAGSSAFTVGALMATTTGIVAVYAMPGGIFCTLTAFAGLIFIIQILVSLTRSAK